MKVLVGYDGSESSDALLDDLRRAGLPGDAEVALVAVASERPGGGDEAEIDRADAWTPEAPCSVEVVRSRSVEPA